MNKMKQVEYLAFIAIGIISVILCWYEIWDLVSLGFVGAWIEFFKQTQATPVTRFLNWDASSVTITFAIWAAIEFKTKKLKYAPVFILTAFLIAISLAFPLYLVYRDYVLSKRSS